MAVPTQPTLSDLCAQGLQRGGQYNYDATQLTLAQSHFIQEVKADIMRIAANNPLLQTSAVAPTVRGQQRYTIPADHNRSELLILLDGPDTWRGTAQAGTASSITLSSSIDDHEDVIEGKWVLLTGGTGVGQYRQIVDWNNTTKVATPDTNFDTAPNTTTTFLIVSTQRELWPLSFVDAPHAYPIQQNVSVPLRASLFNQEFWLNPPPDKSTYGLLHHYYVDLSKVDETGDLFLQLLREWRSLWIQGVAAYTMQRYDDERFPVAWQMYQSQLVKLAADSPQYSQCVGAR